ncbi:MAG: peptide chain release factor N(5)-glutamine methyltransferase [Lachnospiraceae bacterium]|nr:peptide chain release factor N(5)-glutamine methyltransferase [Lachnospiraceae bacterium]
MASYDELRNMGQTVLKEAGIDDAATDARLLLEFVTGLDRNGLIMQGPTQAGDDIEGRYKDLIDKRAAHVPLQHLTGHQEFMGLDFAVNEHVLVPRLDTECLVEEAMRYVLDGMRVLDLCTGSGCIIISLARYKNDLEAVGLDISKEALELARENALRNGVEVDFALSDLYEKAEGRFDVIVSNPPYIRRDVIDTLMEEVKDHEPRIALDGGEDGLDFYRRLLDGADDHLIPGGMIFFEIGYDQGQAVSQLMEDHGFKDVTVVKDLAGNDRVVHGRLSVI